MKHMCHKISLKIQMGHLVGRIQATNYLYFIEDELDLEGTWHNKPLYITMRYKDCLISKVLVDNGSTLNVLPKHMLHEMPIDTNYIRPSTMTARTYATWYACLKAFSIFSFIFLDFLDLLLLIQYL